MRPHALRTLGLVLVLLPMPWTGAVAQGPCTPTSTNGLRLFGAGSEMRFEPSAVVRLPGECAVLVFSDKSETLEALRFAVSTTGLGTAEHVVPAGAVGVVQLEAATAVGDEGVLVVTSGTYKGAGFIDQSREDRALLMQRDSAGAWTVGQDLSVPWERFLRGLRDEAGGWLKVEGLATLGERYLVGIRQFGDAYDRFDYGLRVAVWDPDEPNIQTLMADPRSVTFEEEGDAAGTERTYMRTYGISSLECDAAAATPEPVCFMLVSSEAGPGVYDVKSRLLAFTLEELADATSIPGREIACFWNKAEGLTLLDGGTALVVFDSDRDRKGGAGGSDLFPLQDYQDYYWIGSVDRPATGAVADPEPTPCVGP